MGGAIMVTMALVTIPLMDRLGRRTLHLAGLAGMLFFGILLTVALNLDPSSSGVGIFLVASTLAFVFSFGFGPSTVPWLITSELFTQGPRTAAVPVVTLVNWVGNMLVGFTFPSMAVGLGAQAFIPFIVAIAVSLAVLYVYLPET